MKPRDRGFSNKRLYMFRKILWIVPLVVGARIAYLHTSLEKHDTIQTLATKQYQSRNRLKAFRGTILDRNGNTLAISIQRPSIAINPKRLSSQNKVQKALSRATQIPISKIKKISKKNSYFAWLNRKTTYAIADRVQKLSIPGVHIIPEPHRYYPQAMATANLLGFVGTDHKGLLGLEHYLEQRLVPKETQFLRKKDAKGRPMAGTNEKDLSRYSGKAVTLTIDTTIQEIAYEAIKKWTQKSQAHSGFAIVADPHSGELLAIANFPSFNPNQPGSFKIPQTRNRALFDLFEPGSVIKTFIVAAALNQKVVEAQTSHNCEKTGRFAVKAGGPFIRDDHPHAEATTAEVIAYSSNICTFKIARLLGRETVYNYLKNFGFSNHPTTTDLPGQISGRIQTFSKWSAIRFANISFGQGFLASGSELVAAFSAIANGGWLLPLKLIQQGPRKQPASRQVIDAATAYTMRQILKKTVEDGTGTRAQTKSYDIAGKTSTAEIFDVEKGLYVKNKRMAGFAGFAPADDPYITILIRLDQPQVRPYYGGQWAAPAFSEIAEKTLRYLNVPNRKSKKIAHKLGPKQRSGSESNHESKNRFHR